jgi:hypothetical protein
MLRYHVAIPAIRRGLETPEVLCITGDQVVVQQDVMMDR